MHLFVICFARLVVFLTLSHDQPPHNTRMWTGILLVLLHWHLCDWFWAWLSICTHFAAVKQCFHIVLKVCDGFLPLVHLQPTKITSLHAAFLWCIRKAGGATLTLPWLQYDWPVEFESISWSWREFSLLSVSKISNTMNTISFKVGHCGEFLTLLYIIFEIFASLHVHTWSYALCHFVVSYTEGTGSTFQNVSIHLSNYMLSKPRTPQYKHQNSAASLNEIRFQYQSLCCRSRAVHLNCDQGWSQIFP
jgi:hypothetical protein